VVGRHLDLLVQAGGRLCAGRASRGSANGRRWPSARDRARRRTGSSGGAARQLADLLHPELRVLERVGDELRGLPLLAGERRLASLSPTTVSSSPAVPHRAGRARCAGAPRRRPATIRPRDAVSPRTAGGCRAHGELTCDQPHDVEPVRRERAADEAVLEHQHRPQRAAARRARSAARRGRRP